MSTKVQIALVGASGFAGQVFAKHLAAHPTLAPLEGAAWPDPRAHDDAGVIRSVAGADAVALALPEGPAKAWTAALMNAGARRVLDLSGAHRQSDGIHYGIPELFGAPPSTAKLVANPGCYPTATLLATAPLLRAGLIEPGASVVGCSGASGAGKGLRDDLHFCHLESNTFPYNVGRHRHAPEIERHLGCAVDLVTQLLPITRGMLVTAFVRPQAEPHVLAEALREFYAPHPWVTVLDAPDATLGVRHLVGTHQARVAVGPRSAAGTLPVFCAIDNLCRGAATQALHNLNLWLGLDPGLGLPAPLKDTPTSLPSMGGSA